MENKKSKRQRIDEAKAEVEERRFTRCAVGVIPNHKNLTSVSGENFDWPEFTKERDRVKAFTQRFAEKSISEAFNSAYGTPAKKEEPALPISLKRGERIKVQIDHIFDGNVTFKNLTTKEAVVCRNNLSRYKHINPCIYNMELTAEVVDVNKKQVTVDILQPIFDEWIQSVMEDPTNQYDIKSPEVVFVENLQLTQKGFLGHAVVPPLTNLLGEPYRVDAFIPGSHIVLNIETDFEKWNGSSVPTFVSNYVPRANSLTQKSLVCSRKNYFTYLGDLEKIDMFKHWCEDDEKWKEITKNSYYGKVTGIINSSKKCGVFVEIPSLLITGMVNLPAEEIVKYKPGQEIYVHIVGFEDMTYYDEVTKQRVHAEPYRIEDGKLRKCILKPVLELV